MSRADLRFLLKVIALVGLVVAGGVIAGFKILGAAEPVSLDCGALAASTSSGVTYPDVGVSSERRTSDSAKWCELTVVGPDGVSDVVRVAVERFSGDVSSEVDGCRGVAVAGGEGCLANVDGAGTPGSNGATARIVVTDGDLRVDVEVRMSPATLARVQGLAGAAGQGAEAYVLADFARFAEAGRDLAGH